MALHKLETIVYALGFVEDYIDSNTEPVELDENWPDDTTRDAKDTNEYHEQVRNMMKVLSEGVTQLRRENTSLQNKLLLVQSALNTPT